MNTTTTAAVLLAEDDLLVESRASWPLQHDFLSYFNPDLFDWCLLVLAFIIFVVGIIGNLLVIIVVAKNPHMRTITNIFIVNLAIGDFLVILICLPPTVITDISSYWFFGETMCKIIPYVQYISVCVSVMTLTSISYERYYAIVYPLKFQATKFRAKIILLVIWILSVLINVPHPIVIRLHYENGTFFCYPTWDNIFQNISDLLIFVILYIVPMTLIFYTYTRVVKVLWRIDKSIAWDESTCGGGKQSTRSNNNNNHYYPYNRSHSAGTTTTYTFPKKSGGGGGGGGGDAIDLADDNQNNIAIMESGGPSPSTNAIQAALLKPPPGPGPMYTPYTMASGSSAAMSKMKNQLIARRKAAKMLISVAVLFAICYLPIHILNIIRFIASNALENFKYSVVLFQIAHCLVYVNSCVNPLIYNFMSDNFRKEFRKIIFCNIVKSAHSSELASQNELKVRYLNGASVGSGSAPNRSNAAFGGVPKSSSSSNYRLYQ